jgi:hypothetical protein
MPKNQIHLAIGFNMSLFSIPQAAPPTTMTWTDVSAYLMELNTQRGRMHELNRIEAGKATFILNNTDGRFWRYNTSSPYYPYVKPLTPIQLYCIYNTVVYFIYTGMIESLVPGWVEDVGGKTPIMTINCVDLFKTFTRETVPQGTNYGSELSGARVNHLLGVVANTATNGATWPAGLKAVDTGKVTVTALTPPANGTNIMEHLYKVASADSGVFFVAGDGKVTFQDRDSRYTNFANSSATFDTGTSGNIYTLPEMSDDDTFIYNAAMFNNAGNAISSWQEPINLANQGVRIYDGTGSIIQNTADAQNQAYIVVNRYFDSKLRVKSLHLDCDASPLDLFPKALGYDISTRITLNLNNADNPMAIPNVQYHIEGIEHDWKAWQDCWHSKFQLWDVNQYQLFPITHSGFLETNNPLPNYTTVHNQASGDAYDDSIGYHYIYAGQSVDTNYWIYRGYIEFDTTALASLPASATAKVFIWWPATSIPTADVTVNLVDPAGLAIPLITTNYHDLLTSTASHGQATFDHTNTTARWIEFDMSTPGLSAINPGGTTRWGMRSLADVGSVAPSTATEYLVFDGAGTSSMPQAFLVVNFGL